MALQFSVYLKKTLQCQDIKHLKKSKLYKTKNLIPVVYMPLFSVKIILVLLLYQTFVPVVWPSG